ncbi:MAG: type I restriction endonuclease subunit R [Gemmataceae bacterium]
MSSPFNELDLQAALLNWFEQLEYEVLFGPGLSPGGDRPERETYSDVVLVPRLREALVRLNPHIPQATLDDTARKVITPESPSLIESNRAFHRMLTLGVPVEFRDKDGNAIHDSAKLVDFSDPHNNDWLAVNHFRIIEAKQDRICDTVVFLNGLPIGVIELKSPSHEDVDVRDAFRQLQTYKAEIPNLFCFNELMIASDGHDARVGSLTANMERFMPWRTPDGKPQAASVLFELETFTRELLNKEQLLDLLRSFVVFDDDGSMVIKKIAGYHQYHAVNKAVEHTVRAAGPDGDKRIGVVWHTQGSGKSLSMAFYAGKVIQQPELANPTLVVLTDRNDLDDQLFGTFSRCKELLRQDPVQAENREHLRELLQVAAGGVVFTTIQKFLPEKKGDSYPKLSDRRNIIVIADEAHRSQYDFIDGFARHMRDALPNASFIGFTGTPLQLDDKNTRAVFGEYIDIYDIQRAVDDGATVPIYYEGRLAKINIDEDERPTIDSEFEEITEGEEEQSKHKLKTKWAKLESMVGTPNRVELVARDLVEHFDRRLDVMDGKAMIVCMSRRICIDLYNAIIKLRPGWHNEDDEHGAIKVVMTGSAADGPEWQQHIRTKARREFLGLRFKDAADPLKLVIVRDMWLTGFDAPCMHTMYIDKPMQGHALMQAIARVNRVFKNKPGGLVVDSLGLAEQLKYALANYANSGGHGDAALNQEDAVAVLLEKYEIVCDLFHGFDYLEVIQRSPAERMSGIVDAMNFILEPPKNSDESRDQRKREYMQASLALSKAFALAVPHEQALAIRDEIAFFPAVRAGIAKLDAGTHQGPSPDMMDSAIRQIVSKAVVSDEVVDIFSAAGLKNPDISILSDEFLAEVRNMPQRNLALELLRKLLSDEIKTLGERNLVQSRSFLEMLEEAIRRYQNRSIEAAQVIAELIEIAKKMREAHNRGDDLSLSDDELAFYDALGVNDSAVQVLGDQTLCTIARELVKAVRNSVTIDWSERESARAQIRVLVKRILKRYGYPPDKAESATDTVLQQAKLLCKTWAR